jgi:hypothetical protein
MRRHLHRVVAILVIAIALTVKSGEGQMRLAGDSALRKRMAAIIGTHFRAAELESDAQEPW